MGNQEETTIRRHIGSIVDAIGRRDLDGLSKLYAADIVSYDVEPPLQHRGVEAKLENWARVFEVFTSPVYEVRDLVVELDGDLAVAHGFGRLSGTLANGTQTDGMWVRVTFCLRKVDGNWLIAHDHVSVPLDIRTGLGIVDLEPSAPS